jgi:hypothetical protein
MTDSTDQSATNKPRSSGPRHAAKKSGRSTTFVVVLIVVVVLLIAGGATWLVVRQHGGSSNATTTTTAAGRLGSAHHGSTTSLPSTTTTTTGSTSVFGPITSPPLPAPGPGFEEGHVTAVGDSVMLDYQAALESDIPGIDVQAAVSRQWGAGEAQLRQDKAVGNLGAVVIVGLGTNGPISDADIDSMMSVLSGASRVVFVNIVVGQPWGAPNNVVLANAVTRYPNAVVADWAGLSAKNPGWVYSDGTHLPIGGTGAQALAALIAQKA